VEGEGVGAWACERVRRVDLPRPRQIPGVGNTQHFGSGTTEGTEGHGELPLDVVDQSGSVNGDRETVNGWACGETSRVIQHGTLPVDHIYKQFSVPLRAPPCPPWSQLS
jgi:hypothetical protein